jgi:hypothetical protein
MIHRFQSILRIALLCSLPVLGQAAFAKQAQGGKATSGVYSLVESTKLARYNDITFFVRMPHGSEADLKRKRERQSESSVRGV